jgi:hypothetical protein
VNSPFRLLVVLLVLVAASSRAEEASLDPNLEPLRPWLGKTWKSEAAEPGDKAKVDIAHWERALNGKAVRMRHSINDGEYGGETIFVWDAAQNAVVYHYFTTAGFRTTGTMKFENGKLVSHEKVQGNAGGIAEVRGTSEMRGDGSFELKTEYLKDGKWQPGRQAVYREDAAAAVVFK